MKKIRVVSDTCNIRIMETQRRVEIERDRKSI